VNTIPTVQPNAPAAATSQRPDVSIIVHAFARPEPAVVEALRGRAREAVRDAGVELIEAYENAANVVGAAALINAAVRRAQGRVLLVLEASVLPRAEGVRALIEAAANGGLALEREQPPLEWQDQRAAEVAPDASGLLARIDESLRRAPGEDPGAGGAAAPNLQPTLKRQPMWAIARVQFDALGGLDGRFWSIGAIDDLHARACRAGVLVQLIDMHAEPTGIEAYPLRPEVARFLRARNPLLTAFKTLPAAALGEALAHAAARALSDAWRATGLSDKTFQFGGAWGRGSRVQRLLRGATGGSRLPVRLHDPDGCLLPLLAIDSALDEFESLERPTFSSAENATDAEGVRATGAPLPASAAASASAAAAQPTSGAASARSSDAASASEPFVSVIIVNWNGREHLRDCFGSLSRSDYPADRLELICVDNGSTDGSRDFLAAEFPHVKVIALDRNRGFTGGNEAGVAAARGDVLVFLNNDMRVEPDCLRELVRPLDQTSTCVGARVLSWDGRYIDFIRGSLNFEGRGFQDFYGVPNLPELSTPTETFFPNGGAFAVTREAYQRAGGFDPSFFAYYDDVDLGWRLRLTGAGIRVAGRAVVYHRHGATSRTQPKGQKRFLMERNALWTLMKNYSDRALPRALGIALALAVRRLLDETNIDARAPVSRTLAPFARRVRGRNETAWPADVVYQVAAPHPPAPSPQAGRGSNFEATRPSGSGGRQSMRAGAIRAMPLESLGAMGMGLTALPRIIGDRAAAQAARRTPDSEILPRFGRDLEAVSSVSSYKRLQHVLTEAHDLPELFRTRTRLLIIGHEAIATNMSGPAVRVLEMGRALSSVARVTIATPFPSSLEDARVTFATFQPQDPAGLRRLAEDADVLLVQGFTLAQYPFLKTLHVPVIVDLYCPFTLEHLEQLRARQTNSAAAQQDAAGVLGVQNDQLRDGDFFICASEAQRDFWIGTLHSHGRINPLTYADDPTLRRLIDVVPFGLSEESAAAAASHAQQLTHEPGRNVMKGVRPGISATDRVLLWAGSMLDWQDPLTLIRAVADLALARGRRDIKLLFMGTKHPNPLVSPMRVIEESRALAQQLGVLDTHVFFNDWVPYDQRARYLVEADIGVSTHRDHLETHFSFRTRMLDYIWAGLPIVCTRGDFFAGLVEARDIGVTVPPADVAALSQALADLLDDPAKTAAMKRRLDALRFELRWSTVTAPLARYCAQPHFAADRAPAMRAFRSRLEQQYRGAKWLKRTALRLGLSEYRIERLKQSGVGRAAMTVQSRLALHRARRSG
jgi:GT2 family glycosyltransferase/glycosyltransferase involved in cell wall biosynthesis